MDSTREADVHGAASPSTHWIVPLRTVAIVAGVFGLSCLGVLVVVTALDSKDALSTVALSLAILAFSVQLIVFVAQQGLAAEQARRNEELYGSMQGLLAEIREKAAGTQADVRAINEKMLGAIIAKNIAGTPGGQLDYGDLGSQVARAIAQTGDGFGPAGTPGGAPIWPERRPDPSDWLYLERLRSFPEEDEVGESLQILKRLPNEDRERLKSFGDDEIVARQPESPFDPSLTALAVGGLEEAGLVEPYPPDRQPPNGPWVFRLTDRGRDVARLLTAPGDPPAYLPGLQAIREATPDRLDWQSWLRR